MLEDMRGQEVLPIGRSGTAHNVVEGDLTVQLRNLERQAGLAPHPMTAPGFHARALAMLREQAALPPRGSRPAGSNRCSPTRPSGRVVAVDPGGRRTSGDSFEVAYLDVAGEVRRPLTECS
ncbi:hypothetical protein [Microtetraspora sp. NBRC 16547]|uniref:hypothetical protein n=1 Tax=Microtetraspora sp. NBRC 16547 TaxID=3030993 RepID=UPI0024A560B7|nr:hypothetical protein [Microtetraspora sp. NBRC 16547]GLX02306.1 hypothetical protein Misp02_63920 [Microtetraspora sp. NBRC 16547]